MRQLPFKRHRFPANIIRHSIWPYARFILSYRDADEMLAEQGWRIRRLAS
jgi:transposase-like protein